MIHHPQMRYHHPAFPHRTPIMPNEPKVPNDPGFSIQAGASDATVDSLDFEHADRTSGTARACAQCATPITDRYFTLGSHVLCESCHLAFQNVRAPGNAASRFFGAAALGTVAAAIGCALWMLVTELTGYEIGLIAIAIGYLVGMAVHVGARRVGGVAYQLLAVFLTYSAIVMTYVPMIANQFIAADGARQEVQGDVSDEAQIFLSDDSRIDLPDDSQTAPSGDSQTALSDDWAEDDTANSAPGANAGGDVEAPVTKPGVDELAAWITAIPIAYMLPFLMGFENAIGILIIGFALWQSFRMNARAKIELQGPFRLEADDATLG
jgi:hypothetical protein